MRQNMKSETYFDEDNDAYNQNPETAPDNESPEEDGIPSPADDTDNDPDFQPVKSNQAHNISSSCSEEEESINPSLRRKRLTKKMNKNNSAQKNNDSDTEADNSSRTCPTHTQVDNDILKIVFPILGPLSCTIEGCVYRSFQRT